MPDLDPFADLTKPYSEWYEDDNPIQDDDDADDENLTEEEREKLRKALINLL
jgi:hypothetical protein